MSNLANYKAGIGSARYLKLQVLRKISDCVYLVSDSSAYAVLQCHTSQAKHVKPGNGLNVPHPSLEDSSGRIVTDSKGRFYLGQTVVIPIQKNSQREKLFFHVKSHYYPFLVVLDFTT